MSHPRPVDGGCIPQLPFCCPLPYSHSTREAVCELFGGDKESIIIIGIRHGKKMYETLLTNEECKKAIDMGNFYRVPSDNRGSNYDNYFANGNMQRNPLHEFDSNNTELLTVAEVKEKLFSLSYIREQLSGQET